jgi:hypothetical protein
MPGCYQHMFLMEDILRYIKDATLRGLIKWGRAYLRVGAVAPDLPYASVADSDFFLSSHSNLADKFHHERTNHMVLRGLRYIKWLNQHLLPNEIDALFCFIMGYASHVVADGVIHPFILDKVGDYSRNRAAHRLLELKLDVIYLDYSTRMRGKPLNLNGTNYHDKLKEIFTSKERWRVFEVFTRIIGLVYEVRYSPAEIGHWIEGLHRMLAITEGEHWKIYRGLLQSCILPDMTELEGEVEKICLLTTPRERSENFLKRESVHYLRDCIPRFYEVYLPLLLKGYRYLYREGDSLTEKDLPGVDLDTGRSLYCRNNLEMVPEMWHL